MKISNLIKEFEIFTTNEEKQILDKIGTPCYIDTFSDREQFVIENLVKKSLLSKVQIRGSTVVVPNENSK
jgi:hypothetical protein